MPVSYINAEVKIPALVIGYLNAQRTVLDLPTSTALPFVASLQEGTEDFTLPCVTVEANNGDIQTNAICEWKVTITLINKMRGEKTQNAAITTLAVESVWLAKLRYALSDKTAFLAWCGAQDAADRDGYNLTGWSGRSFSTDTDPVSRIRKRVTEFRAVIRTFETASY